MFQSNTTGACQFGHFYVCMFFLLRLQNKHRPPKSLRDKELQQMTIQFDLVEKDSVFCGTSQRIQAASGEDFAGRTNPPLTNTHMNIKS